jgi:hypothetical protein
VKAALEVTGYSPEVITQKTGKNAFIRCEMIEVGREGRPERTGKYIHLQLTASDAVRLLGLLQAAQNKHQWSPTSGEPTVVSIPPTKDRH